MSNGLYVRTPFKTWRLNQTTEFPSWLNEITSTFGIRVLTFVNVQKETGLSRLLKNSSPNLMYFVWNGFLSHVISVRLFMPTVQKFKTIYIHNRLLYKFYSERRNKEKKCSCNIMCIQSRYLGWNFSSAYSDINQQSQWYNYVKRCTKYLQWTSCFFLVQYYAGYRNATRSTINSLRSLLTPGDLDQSWTLCKNISSICC